MKSQRWLMGIKGIIASPAVYGKVVVLPSGDTPVEEESCQAVGDTKQLKKVGCIAPEELFPRLNCWQGTKVGVTEAFAQSSTSSPHRA